MSHYRPDEAKLLFQHCCDGGWSYEIWLLHKSRAPHWGARYSLIVPSDGTNTLLTKKQACNELADYILNCLSLWLPDSPIHALQNLRDAIQDWDAVLAMADGNNTGLYNILESMKNLDTLAEEISHEETD